MTLAELEREIRTELAAAGLAQPRQEAAWLLAQIGGYAQSQLYCRPDQRVAEPQLTAIRQAARRRAAHEPMAYILGEAGFFGLLFQVGPGVLIPRPDTEILVETALAEIARAWPAGSTVPRPLRILDTCTGSGCVGISLASRLNRLGYAVNLTLLDTNARALAYARANVDRHQLTANTRICQADLWPDRVSLAGQADHFDVVAANPPYIRPDVIQELMPDVRDFEPVQALDGGLDGLDFYRRLTREAPARLDQPGLLLFEHGYDQAAAVADLLTDSGWTDCLARLDYGGQPRVAGGWYR